jgi:hypothetical protein
MSASASRTSARFWSDFAAFEALREHDLVACHHESTSLVYTHFDIVRVDLHAATQAQFFHFRRLRACTLLARLL